MAIIVITNRKTSYRDNRENIAINNISKISHRPTHCRTHTLNLKCCIYVCSPAYTYCNTILYYIFIGLFILLRLSGNLSIWERGAVPRACDLKLLALLIHQSSTHAQRYIPTCMLRMFCMYSMDGRNMIYLSDWVFIAILRSFMYIHPSLRFSILCTQHTVHAYNACVHQESMCRILFSRHRFAVHGTSRCCTTTFARR